MRALKISWLLLFSLALPSAAQTTPTGTSEPAASLAPQGKVIDGIAARIENDILTESQVSELQHYQQLVDGEVQSRAAVIQDLVDQWIVRSEAATTKFPRPTEKEVDAQFGELVKQFPSRQQFEKQLRESGLTENEVRQLIARQLYYARFLDYKFHAAARVTMSQIQDYYQNELAPQVRKHGRSVPPLGSVEAKIRELLTQEAINEKASQWLEETKARLKIVLQPGATGG